MTSPLDEADILRAHIATLEELLDVHERTALAVTRRLEDESKRLQEIFESLPAAISIIAFPEMTVSYANSQARALLDNDDVAGKHLSELIPDIEAQGYIDVLNLVGSTGEPQYAREAKIILEQDGHQQDRYFNYAFVPVRDPSGAVTAILSHAVEVTEMTAAHREVESLVDDLRLVAELSRAVNVELSVKGVGQAGAEGAASILRATRCVLTVRALQHEEGLEPIVVGDEDGPFSHLEPLTGNDEEQIGSLEISREEPIREGDKAIVGQIARLIAVAIERARAYERQHKIAEVLQRSLLPATLPEFPGITVATRYRPGGSGEEVGGDWYDVIEMPDGRVGLVLGDVGGKGVRSASIMGQIRTAVRAYAMGGNEPTAIMAKSDRLLQSIDPDHMVTVAFLALDTASGKATVISAGHPPPVILEPGKAPRLLPITGGLPFGIIPDAQYHAESFSLDDGTVVLLYSDGLVERRGQVLDDGFARLLEVVRAGPEDLERLCDHVLSQMVSDELADDVALLAFRASVLAKGPLDLEFPSQRDQVPRARHILDRYIEAVGAGPEDATDIVIAAAEACANAVEHGYANGFGSVRLRARRDGDSITVTIWDAGRWRDPTDQPWRGRGLRIMRQVMNEVHVSHGEDGTEVTLRKQLGSERRDATA